MNINKLDEDIANQAFKAFSVTAPYRFPSSIEKRCRAIINHGSAGFPNDWQSQVQDAHVEIILKVKDVTRRSQGDLITVSNKEYTVANIVADDGVIIRTRQKITCHFCIPDSRHLRPILIRKILNVELLRLRFF